MNHVQRELSVSGRRACQVLGQSRSTQRYEAKEDSIEEQRLVSRMHAGSVNARGMLVRVNT